MPVYIKSYIYVVKQEEMRIKDVLKEKGMTYQILADAMEVSLQSVKRMLNAESITTATAERIAKAVGVPVWELFVKREEVIGEDLIALVSHKGNYYKAETISELENIVESIKSDNGLVESL